MNKAQIVEVQTALIGKGYNLGKSGADGKYGALSRTALLAAIKATPVVKPSVSAQQPLGFSIKFDAKSAAALAEAHPDMQRLMNAAREQAEFIIMDSRRGRDAQEKAFKQGHSKVHFGDSAHNYTPAFALDVAPGTKVDWNNKQAFIDLAQKVILPLAKKMAIPIRWGGDWNMDGSISDGWDFPHYELHPWRSYAKKAKLYGE